MLRLRPYVPSILMYGVLRAHEGGKGQRAGDSGIGHEAAPDEGSGQGDPQGIGSEGETEGLNLETEVSITGRSFDLRFCFISKNP
jgi:hypothetical protein